MFDVKGRGHIVHSIWKRCSSFLFQDNRLAFNATAVTLGQGHTKVIQYISKDLWSHYVFRLFVVEFLLIIFFMANGHD